MNRRARGEHEELHAGAPDFEDVAQRLALQPTSLSRRLNDSDWMTFLFGLFTRFASTYHS